MGVGLIRSLQPWDILLIYRNNYFKKYITPLLTVARGAFSIPFLMSVSEAFSLPFQLIKLCYTKAFEWSSLVPGPEVRFSSSEITNWTSFTISYHFFMDFPRLSHRLIIHGIVWLLSTNYGYLHSSRSWPEWSLKCLMGEEWCWD